MNNMVSQIIHELTELQKKINKLDKSFLVPRIEHDLILTKLQNIYESLLNISINEPSPENEQLINKTESQFILTEKGNPEPSNLQKEQKQLEPTEKNIKPGELFSSGEDLINIDDSAIIKEELHDLPLVENLKNEKVIKPAEEIDKPKEKEILAERYRKNQTYINELLAQGYQKKDISSLMQSKAIKNIEVSVGVNEKFLFIKELFSGDTDTYLKTIRKLNNAANFNEAFNYIHSTFSWNLESEAAQKLLDLVRRRFIVDEEGA